MTSTIGTVCKFCPNEFDIRSVWTIRSPKKIFRETPIKLLEEEKFKLLRFLGRRNINPQLQIHFSTRHLAFYSISSVFSSKYYCPSGEQHKETRKCVNMLSYLRLVRGVSK